MSNKRLRIFAGPNGSGKSTLYNYLVSQKFFNPYYYINPDEFAKNLYTGLNFVNWKFDFNPTKVMEYLNSSTYNLKTERLVSNSVIIEDKQIQLKEENNKNISYIAAALAEWVRLELLKSNSSFTFETVFSHSSKLDFIDVAKKAGYKTYLYFISTDDVLINIERVKARVSQGGHNVDASKIESRYQNAMKQLLPALKKVDKAFLFDNTTIENITCNNAFDYFACKENDELIFTNNSIPQWFSTYASTLFENLK